MNNGWTARATQRASRVRIPTLPVRVLAVADVYDALVSRRAYAEARTPFDAMSVMRQELDQHLDPEV